MVTEWWKQTIQPARQHRFSGTRRANQQQVMPAGSGDLQRSLSLLLADNIAEIVGAFRRYIFRFFGL